jgi:hypothetical protein
MRSYMNGERTPLFSVLWVIAKKTGDEVKTVEDLRD